MARGSMRPLPGLTGNPLDRADNMRGDAGKMATLRADPAARLLALDGLGPVMAADGSIQRLPLEQGDEALLLFLGLEGDTPLFVRLPDIAPQRVTGGSLAHLFGALGKEDMAVWGMARGLIEWHARSRFCGICGAATEILRAGWARHCNGCGAEHFPRVDPVVIMLAEFDGKVLVGRGLHFGPRRYSALAGFIEPGESIEEAVARELMEEAGIAVSDVTYVASQPWPFPGSLMIGCIAQARGDALTVDTSELADAIWVSRAEVRAALAGDTAAPFDPPFAFAIAHDLLAWWLQNPA